MTNHPGIHSSDKLSWWHKIGYGMGDIYGGGAHFIVSLYYLYFLTSVVRINPGLAGVVILLSKGYDAITDPLEGVLTDRTRTRFGRRKPYLAAGLILIFLSFFTLFYPFTFESETMRFVFVLLTYLFFSTVFSIVQLNYNALQSEMTLDYHERTSLSVIRIFFSSVSSIIAAIVPLTIVNQFDSVRDGYLTMGLVFGLFFAIPYIATVVTVKEREDFQRPPEPFDWRKTFILPFRMRTFVYVLIIYLFSFMAADILGSINIFFMKYYLMRGDETQFVNGTLLIVQVFSLPAYLWLSRRTNKQTGIIIGALIWISGMVLSLLLRPEQPSWIVYLFAGYLGMGSGGIIVMVYSMFPDIPDVDELESGERREGMYSSLIGLMRKMSSAIALFIVSQVLQFGGYIAPVEEIVGSATKLVEQPQTESFIMILRVVFAITPIVLLSISLFVALRYPLTAEVHNELKELLAARRNGEQDTSDRDKQAARLRQLLIGKNL